MKTIDIIADQAKHGHEVVICSAIRWRGKVWRGHRHGDAMEVQHSELSYTMTRKEMMKERVNKEQGFITSRNRFVDREEAFTLHRQLNIPSHSKDGYRGIQLYSEDLY